MKLKVDSKKEEKWKTQLGCQQENRKLEKERICRKAWQRSSQFVSAQLKVPIQILCSRSSVYFYLGFWFKSLRFSAYLKIASLKIQHEILLPMENSEGKKKKKHQLFSLNFIFYLHTYMSYLVFKCNTFILLQIKI